MPTAKTLTTFETLPDRVQARILQEMILDAFQGPSDQRFMTADQLADLLLTKRRPALMDRLEEFRQLQARKVAASMDGHRTLLADLGETSGNRQQRRAQERAEKKASPSAAPKRRGRRASPPAE